MSVATCNVLEIPQNSLESSLNILEMLGASSAGGASADRLGRPLVGSLALLGVGARRALRLLQNRRSINF